MKTILIAGGRMLADAARTYARAAKLGLEAQNHATEIKLRAERKAGELLGELERKPGERVDRLPDSVSLGSQYRQAIESAEVEERQARRWQEVAKIPEPVSGQSREINFAKFSPIDPEICGQK